MICADGIWFPDGEVHLVKMLKDSPKIGGKGTYQYHKLEAALRYVKRRRCALDIGAHVGLWAMHLAKEFETVIGFEPVADHLECLRLNMAGIKNYQVYDCALGDQDAVVGMRIFETSTGSSQVEEKGEGIILRRLDDFALDMVDFIKIDVEGYEYFVVKGGEWTIKTHRPVIILEQKPMRNPAKSSYGRAQHDARDLLVSWGAKQLFDISGDCCLAWT